MSLPAVVDLLPERVYVRNSSKTVGALLTTTYNMSQYVVVTTRTYFKIF